MGSFCKGNRSLAVWFRLAGCVIALGMAIILPALRTSNFGPSYKPVEVRQAAVRHECLVLCDDWSDTKADSVALSPAPVPLAVINPLPATAYAWRAAMLLMAHPIEPRPLRRLRIASDPCGPPYFLARA
jgi:hypothetical protein